MKIFLLLTLLITSLHAITFTDNFDRATLGSSWNTYVEAGPGTNGISNGKLWIYNPDETTGDNFVYYDLGQNLYGVVVSGTMKYDAYQGHDSFYMAINATQTGIKHGDGAGWHTYGKGYGIEISPNYDLYPSYTDNKFYYFLDESKNTGSSLATGPVGLNDNQEYNFEMTYNLDKSLEVRFWNIGANRPTGATIFYAPSSTPVATGTYLTFGITDEGTLLIDNLCVTNIPEPSGIILCSLAIFIGYFFSSKKK